MVHKRIFKWGKRKKSAPENVGSPSGANVPSNSHSDGAGVQSSSPKPMLPIENAEPAPPSPLVPASPPLEKQQNQVTATITSNNNNWTYLTSFLDLLNRIPVLAPFAEAINYLSWFIELHEKNVPAREEYRDLQTQLEAMFKELLGYFSEDTPPAMTGSVLNLCEAILTELKDIYGTQDRNTISRYMQANYDLDKITRCYRRVQVHLERVMLNVNLSVWSTLEKSAAEAQLRNLTPSMSACYDSAEANAAQRRECAPETRKQVLLDLNTWKNNNDGERMCWINGMAGTGKTTIAATLCSTLNKSHELGASFFCNRSLPACRDFKLILPTIAYQLARFSGPFRAELLQILQQDPDVHTKMTQVQFQRMILDPLRKVGDRLPTKVVVVIDALDECDDGDGVGQILEALLENASQMPIKLIVSSRPEYHIRKRIRESALEKQVVLHELDGMVVKADIETYLRAELASISTPPTNDQLSTLVERAGALFIYAATVVRYIKGGHAAERLNLVLKASGTGRGSSNETKEIDRLYGTVLKSAFNEKLEEFEKERTKLLLHTVVCAQEPLTVDAVADLLSLDSARVTEALDPLWSVLHVSESETTHRINILHASFPDYILDSERSREFACNNKVHNGKLAELCLKRIERNIPQFNICQLESSYVFDKDVPHLNELVERSIVKGLLYACQYWATHLSLGGEPNERAAALEGFLSKRLLLWIEVLNLSERMDKGIGQMNRLVSWLENTGCSKSTTLLARDVQRFVVVFATSPISRSTPHLYVSMLPSWPKSRPVSQCYTQRATELVRIKGIETTHRQLSLLSSILVKSESQCVAYSPDGASFAAGTVDGRILVWDAVSCRMTIDLTTNGQSQALRAIAISPDGTRMCAGTGNGTLCLWDLRNGREIAGPVSKGHTGIFLSVDFSRDSLWLVAGSSDGMVRTWSTHDWKMKGDPLDAGDGAIFSVSFSPDSSIIAASSRTLIHLWDPSNGQMVGGPLSGHTSIISSLAFMPHGRHLISGSDDENITIWDVASGQAVFGPFRAHTSSVESVAVSPNGRLIASASRDATIRLWDTDTWQIHSVLEPTSITRSVTFSPDGSRLISGSMDGHIRIWEVSYTTEAQTVDHRTPGHSAWIRSAVFSYCGLYMISGDESGRVWVWDLQTGRPLYDPFKPRHGRILSVGFSVDSRHVFSISQLRIINVWERRSGNLQYEIGPIETDGIYDEGYTMYWPAAFLFDPGRVVCGSYSGRIYMWEGGARSFDIAGHDSPITSIAFSPDGKSFVSASEDGELILWDATSGKKALKLFQVHPIDTDLVVFSPDGSLVASRALYRTICLWSTHTGAPVGMLYGHEAVIRSLAFSPNGKQVVSGSQDKSIRVWDIAGRELALIKFGGDPESGIPIALPIGKQIAVFEGHTDMILSTAFSPNGTQIVSGSSDLTVRLWNVPAYERVSNDSEPEVSSRCSADATTYSWTVDEDGWVCNRRHHLLFWVPPDLRSALLREQNTMLMSRHGCIELDFTNAKIGDMWETCFEPL